VQYNAVSKKYWNGCLVTSVGKSLTNKQLNHCIAMSGSGSPRAWL
jgi:hypothetical protein